MMRTITFNDDLVAHAREYGQSNQLPHAPIWIRNDHRRHRKTLVSRLVGSTHHFVGEAVIRALTTGRNAAIFACDDANAAIIRKFVAYYLAGNWPLKVAAPSLWRINPGGGTFATRPIEIRVFGNDWREARDFNADAYLDQFAWMDDFTDRLRLAQSVSMHGYMHCWSSAGYVEHPSFSFWRSKTDGFYRDVMPHSRATECGAQLFDFDDAKAEYSAAEFQMLFECKFVAAAEGRAR